VLENLPQRILSRAQLLREKLEAVLGGVRVVQVEQLWNIVVANDLFVLGQLLLCLLRFVLQLLLGALEQPSLILLIYFLGP
jgi:hypothetical protein